MRTSSSWKLRNRYFYSMSRYRGNWLNDLKIRGAYGVNGNDLIANDAFYAKYSMDLDRAAYALGGGNISMNFS